MSRHVIFEMQKELEISLLTRNIPITLEKYPVNAPISIVLRSKYPINA